MVWFIVESAAVVLAAAAVGFAIGRAVRPGTPRATPSTAASASPAAAVTSTDALMAQLADCRGRAAGMVDDMAAMRNELATRYAEVVRLTDERDDARAAQSRAQVDLANRTAELILRGEEFARFRAAVRDRYGREPEVPLPPPPAHPVTEVDHHVA